MRLFYLLIILFLFSACGGNSSETQDRGQTSFAWEKGRELPSPPMQKTLIAIFADSGFAKIREYRRMYEAIRHASDLAAAWRSAADLREDILPRLDDYVRTRAGSGLPDLFWLRDALPGLVPQVVSDGAAYHLFADYRQWNEQALSTPEIEDDEFTGLWLAAFPEDSIEYFFPAWTIQISDNEGCSLLGRGIHRAMLGRIDSILATPGGLFAPEAGGLKNRLLDDILRADVHYWEPGERIVQEVEAILAARLRCLSLKNRIALEGRLEQFRNPDVYGVAVNRRAGEE